MQKRVIIDTDPGVDDALAILFALLSPELKVEAITTVNGNVSVEQATKNAAIILDLLDRKPRPILARGAAKPLKKRVFRAQSVHGSNGLGDLRQLKNPDGSRKYSDPQLPQHTLDAIELALDLLKRYADELSLIALGPLTNLAKALMADEKRVKRLREVIVMGGAIRVPGNVTPAAEFNIFVDPHAAQRVFKSGLPITLVPLDVTQKVCLESKQMENLAQEMAAPLGMFLSDCTSKAMEHMEQVKGVAGIYLHDPLAVGVAIDPSLVETKPLHVDVEIRSGITQGMTLADLRAIRDDLKQPTNIHVALGVAVEGFLSLFKERLCPRSL
ncbi:MAG: nucleoside hydrolase [Proteobacteria bacterium]|nr:nucleoside hydrolase [Pseudomonadota bacterium]